MSTMTNPPSPIVLAGQEFTQWRPAGSAGKRASLLAITMDDEWAAAYLGLLGQYVPGLLEDGTAVEFYVSSVQWLGVNNHEVQVIPEARAQGGVL